MQVPFPHSRRRFAVLPAATFLSLVHSFPAVNPDRGIIRVKLDEVAYDARNPGPGDFMDCLEPKGSCQAVLFSRAMADEKIVPPRGMPPDSLRFLTLKGIHAQGGDPILSLALRSTLSGDSVYSDLNGDEDMGNDGPALFWPKRDSCMAIVRSGGTPRIELCRAGFGAKHWRAKCEKMKKSLAGAKCDEPAYRVRIWDIRSGWMKSGGKYWWLGMNDADGDGRFRLEWGDKLVVDWETDGVLDKAADANGIVAGSGAPMRFSLDSLTYEVAGADENGNWIELKRLPEFDPAAAAPRVAEGEPAPDIQFVNMDADTVRLSDLRGRKVLLHFWSPWCKPCLEGLDAVRSFRKTFEKKNWEVISLTAEPDLSLVQQAVLNYKMDWTVGLAGPGAHRFYANRPLPVFIKIDEKGLVENRDLDVGARSF